MMETSRIKADTVEVEFFAQGGNQSTLQSRILGFALKSISCCHDGNNWKGSQLPV